MTDLAVFMSASIPSEDRNPIYFKTADVVAIREAVRNLAATVLSEGQLVFGGHPAISPMVLMVAQRLRATRRVHIYQSKFFRSVVPRESLAFSHITWTPVVRRDRDESLLAMRKKMISSQSFSAGVFIGGMEGVEEEFRLFVEIHPGVPTFPIASTGAAAQVLFKAGCGPLDPVERSALLKEIAYGALFRRVLLKGTTRRRRRRPRSENR